MYTKATLYRTTENLTADIIFVFMTDNNANLLVDKLQNLHRVKYYIKIVV